VCRGFGVAIGVTEYSALFAGGHFVFAFAEVATIDIIVTGFTTPSGRSVVRESEVMIFCTFYCLVA